MNIIISGEPRKIFELFSGNPQKVFKFFGGLVYVQVTAQFGILSGDSHRTFPCVDFAHLYARQQGDIDYTRILKKLPKSFHDHFSGIAYGEKGERKHLKTTKKFFEPLAEALIKRNANVTLINESPQPHKDAAMMKRVVSALMAAKKKPPV